MSTTTPDDHYTRCPQCATIFRVTTAQLAARDGRVRCGQCQAVFDANENALSPAAFSEEEGRDDGDRSTGDAADVHVADHAGQAPVIHSVPSHGAEAAFTESSTETTAHADEVHGESVTAEPMVAPVTSDAPSGDSDSDASMPVSTSDKPATMDSPVDSSSAIALAQTQGEVRPVSAPQADVAMAMPKRAPYWNVLLALAIPVLVLLLLAQAVFHFRDTIASRWPQTSAALARMCEIAGCRLQPLHEIGYLSIEASDLQADPAHKGLLILTATVRNRAPYPLAYPYLELTLTDSQDQPVVRRALAPKEYAGGTTDIDAGIAANAELAVKLFIDASASTQVGYRVYLFYP